MRIGKFLTSLLSCKCQIMIDAVKPWVNPLVERDPIAAVPLKP